MAFNVRDLLDKKLDSRLVTHLRDELASAEEEDAVDDRHYCAFHDRGLSIGTNAERVIETVFLYSEGRDGFRQFDGALPGGLSFAASRDEVRARLGTPAKSGGGTQVPFLGAAAPWDVYFLPDHSVHVEFDSESGPISLVTISTPSATPGRDV